MRRRLASPAQTVSSGIRDEAIDEVSEPLNTTKQLDRRASFFADDGMVERIELALLRIEEEEFNIDEEDDCEVDIESPLNRSLCLRHYSLNHVVNIDEDINRCDDQQGHEDGEENGDSS